MNKKLLCLLGGALLLSQVHAQVIKPLYIDGHLPNITFPQIIHYKDSVATLQDFQGENNKLVIFDFWFTHCGDCIAQFLEEDSLQREFKKDVQFVMVAYERKDTINIFIKNWEKLHHTILSIPIIVADTILAKYVRHLYDPHFAWIAPDNRMIGQTSGDFLTRQNLKSMIKEMNALKKNESEYLKILHNQNLHPHQ